MHAPSLTSIGPMLISRCRASIGPYLSDLISFHPRHTAAHHCMLLGYKEQSKEWAQKNVLDEEFTEDTWQKISECASFFDWGKTKDSQSPFVAQLLTGVDTEKPFALSDAIRNLQVKVVLLKYDGCNELLQHVSRIQTPRVRTPTLPPPHRRIPAVLRPGDSCECEVLRPEFRRHTRGAHPPHPARQRVRTTSLPPSHVPMARA